jgi:hypothetical protein
LDNHSQRRKNNSYYYNFLEPNLDNYLKMGKGGKKIQLGEKFLMLIQQWWSNLHTLHTFGA